MKDSGIPPDHTLVARLRMGDESAFALVLDTWTPSMLRLARSFVSTNASAEEVVQESWLAVIRGIDGFEGRAALKTWVYRILVNTAKKRGITESRLIPFGSPMVQDEAGQCSQHWPEPESAAERAEIRQVVADALTELPDRTRIVLTLRDIEGYTSEEVCEVLYISAGNQRVILHRARAAVRARLEEYLDGNMVPGIHT